MAKDEWQGKSLAELEALLRRKMDEIYALRMEIARRTGDMPGPRYVNFEEYVTR